MDKVWKRLCSFAVTAAITANALPLAVFAEPEQLVSLPETQLEQEILDSDVFYIASPSAVVQEDGNGVYRLRIGRGGDAESESTALVKIADITAKYGKDYYVRLSGTHKKVVASDEAETLLSMMEGSDYTQSELADEENNGRGT